MRLHSCVADERQRDTRFLKKLSNLYSVTAVILVNTLLLIVVLIFALDWALALHHAGNAPSVTPSKDIDLSSYREIDAATARKIVHELDVYASSQPFGFNPWTTFQQRPYRGTFISVENDPVLTHRAVPAPVGGHPRYIVWAFGGSTMFGWGMDDAHTLPAFLQGELQCRLPDRTAEVVNFGQPYWYSSSEVAAFLALLRARPAPNAAVFLDGLNDAAWVASGFAVPVFAGRARAAWDHARAEALRDVPWFSINTSFPLRRTLDWLRYRGMLPPVPDHDFYRHPPANQAKAILDTYRANRRLAAALGAARDVATFFFLQPVPWLGKWKSGRVNADFPFGDKAQAVQALETLAAEARSGSVPRFYSLIHALADIDRPFVDGTHYSDVANHRLARRMAEHIVPGAAPSSSCR